MSEKDNMFEGIGETLELEIENTDALKELFNETKKESLKIKERFENGTYTEDDLLNHLPRFGLGTKDKIEMYVVESKYFEDLVNRYINLKEIEKSHQEENGKLRVEFEKIYQDNLTLADELKQEKVKSNNLQWYFENQKDNFVHKNKIKEKIEKLEKELKDAENAIIANIILGEINTLKNLLEEK